MEKTKNLVAFGEIQKNFKSILDLSLINTLEKLGKINKVERLGATQMFHISAQYCMQFIQGAENQRSYEISDSTKISSLDLSKRILKHWQKPCIKLRPLLQLI